ncbi:Phosphatidylglycerol/phosphatidylinositol transfer protein [Neolecta irregularis DAH-3]|uniref:Phosphatidylglycerol/phosphatidylinositol transfer protein n=1 Tax=Neolecta irregularis (strain DAH-3) TaxID=1198029 RepID=A0A1U7LGS9_NEOID|nr:Phosphatidylglycerol/phosphatidylinositol transfer protein [Neolecta irregularis DAH-3]|eukprot:OLL21731.1 Phosphatidylglycerol/phosphatidylinositol transfer protein [Neolecta irregularis DAH-3]
MVLSGVRRLPLHPQTTTPIIMQIGILLPFFALLRGVFSHQVVFKGSQTVPGSNPLQFCDDSVGTVKIDFINITPNPPLAGHTISIDVKAVLSEEIIEGSLVVVEVKYGFITLLTKTYQLCELASNYAGEECPIQRGELSLSKSIDLPKEIPPVSFPAFAK